MFELVIEPDRPSLPFVDPDRIAAARWPGRELEHGHDATEIATRTRAQLIATRLDFCTETAFSNASKPELIVDANAAGDDGPTEVGSCRNGIFDYRPRWAPDALRSL